LTLFHVLRFKVKISLYFQNVLFLGELTEHKPDFERKAKNKKQNPNQFQEKILAKEKNLKQAWQKSLEDQIHDLPNFDDVFRESKRYFKF